VNRGRTLLFAVTAGVAVGNLYWAQPLLGLIAADLGASAGWVVTTTQIGYAIGVLLIVPLGDVRDRRKLLSGMLLCCATALLGCALAPTIGLLLVATTALGVTTVAGPILMPLAGDLADDAHRGRVVGTVASGLLIGILASPRSVAWWPTRPAGGRSSRSPPSSRVSSRWCCTARCRPCRRRLPSAIPR
jgi:predicted MFS family arabinose efflux permease